MLVGVGVFLVGLSMNREGGQKSQETGGDPSLYKGVSSIGGVVMFVGVVGGLVGLAVLVGGLRGPAAAPPSAS